MKNHGLTKGQYSFGKGLANMAGGLLDVKNTKLKAKTAKYVKRYKG